MTVGAIPFVAFQEHAVLKIGNFHPIHVFDDGTAVLDGLRLIAFLLHPTHITELTPVVVLDALVAHGVEADFSTKSVRMESRAATASKMPSGLLAKSVKRKPPPPDSNLSN